MNKRQNEKNKQITVVLAISLFLCVFFLFLLLVIFRYLWVQEEKPEQETILQEESIEEVDRETENIEETEESEPIVETEETEIVYNPPSYVFDTSQDTITVQIPGLSRNYRIAWVSDVHLVTDLEPAEDVFEEYVETLRDRHDRIFQTPEGIPSNELWGQIIDYLNYEPFDAVIFGGDIMDYCSKSNLDTFLEGYRRLKYDTEHVMYIRADHDYGAWYGGDNLTEWRAHELHAMEIDGHESYDPLQEYDRTLDFGEFMVIGIDGSTKNMSGDQLETVANKLEEGKPVIIATHVPYEPEIENDKNSLAELSMGVRGQIYYWSPESTNYIPIGRTLDYFNYIYGEQSMVRQVCAGHLHAEWDGMLTDTVPQHIFTPAYMGAIGVIEVTP